MGIKDDVKHLHRKVDDLEAKKSGVVNPAFNGNSNLPLYNSSYLVNSNTKYNLFNNSVYYSTPNNKVNNNLIKNKLE